MKHSIKSLLSTGILLVITFFFVLASLFHFRSNIQKREYENNFRSMINLSVQSSSIVEDHFNNWLNTLRGTAQFIQGTDFDSPKIRNSLRNLLYLSEMPFQQIGIADLSGKTLIFSKDSANDSETTINIRDYKFFSEALRYGYSIIDNFDPEEKQDNMFFIAVEIRDENGASEGVLFAGLENSAFSIHDTSPVGHNSRTIQIIDRNGNYILNHPDNSIFDGENLFSQMKDLQSNIPMEDMIWQIKNGETVLAQVKNSRNEYILYFSPLDITDWYVVTAMDQSAITARIDHLLGSDIYLLIVEVSAAVLLLCGVIIFFLAREKKEVFRLYRRLRLKDETILFAVSSTTALIMTYDPVPDTLRIINPKISKFPLPAYLEKASEKLSSFVPINEKTREYLQHITDYINSRSTEPANFEVPLQISSQKLCYRVCLKAVPDQEDGSIQYIVTSEDITETLHLKEEIRMHEQLLSGMFGFVILDLDDDRILQSSENFKFSHASNTSFSTLLSYVIKNFVLKEYQDYALESLSCKGLIEKYSLGVYDFITEYPCYKKDGRTFWLECEIHIEQDRETSHLIAYNVLRNIDQKKQKELVLQERADRDSLTGLYNRGSGTELIDDFLRKQSFSHTHIHAFLILDLDNFKSLNDTLGHHMGDVALQDVADVLRQHFRPYDILCRLAGDEFVLLIKDVPLSVIPKNINALLKKLHLTYEDNNHQVNISASAGISLSPLSGTSFDELYRKADKALYEAKRTRKGSFCFYREE